MTMDTVGRFWLLGLPCVVPVFLTPNLHPSPWDLPLTARGGAVEPTERAASSCLGFSSGCAESLRMLASPLGCLCPCPNPDVVAAPCPAQLRGCRGSKCQRASPGPCLVQMVSLVLGLFLFELALLASKCCSLYSCMKMEQLGSFLRPPLHPLVNRQNLKESLLQPVKPWFHRRPSPAVRQVAAQPLSFRQGNQQSDTNLPRFREFVFSRRAG